MMKSIAVKSTLLALCAGALISCASGPKGPQLDVRTDLGAVPTADQGTIYTADELRLMQRALEDAYPHLPSELQDIARQVVFVISHDPVWTGRVFGWGPEDDPDYRYPDRRFYPRGTIKVTFTQKTIAALRLGERLSRDDSKVAEGALVFARYIIAHQLTHAMQYHREPLSDLLELHRARDTSSICKDGLIDERMLTAAQKRLTYEHQAYGMHRRLIDRDSLLAFADAVELYERTHPTEFAQEGPYHLLASSRPNAFVGKLREEAFMSDKGSEFGPLAKFPNEGQVVPAEVVWALKRLNDSLSGAIRPGLAPQTANAEVQQLRRTWDMFMSGASTVGVKSVLPCDAEQLERRYEHELARYETIARAP